MNQQSSCCTNTSHRSFSLANTILVVGVAFLIAFLVVNTNLSQSIIGRVGREVGNSLVMVMLVGLVASFSTCLAVTGGVIIGSTQLLDTTRTLRSHIQFQTLFHIGRIISFFGVGLLLGWLGESVMLSVGITAWMSIGMGVLFLILALMMLGVVRLPTSLRGSWHARLSSCLEGSSSGWAIPLIGALTFLLPCGFTQSMQLVALASGSPLSGGLIMVAFAIGTIPGLVMFGLGTSYAKDHSRQVWMKQSIAGILLVFGMVTVWGSLSVLGVTQGRWASSEHTVASGDQDATVEHVRIGHTGSSLDPKTLTLQAGKSYELTIMPSVDGVGCMSTMILPGVDTQVRTIQAGVPIVYHLENLQPGQYDIVCSAMGMKQGSLLIEENV